MIVKKKMMSIMVRFYRCDSGAGLIEYGLLAAVVAVACIAALTLVGGDISCEMKTIINDITSSKVFNVTACTPPSQHGGGGGG